MFAEFTWHMENAQSLSAVMITNMARCPSYCEIKSKVRNNMYNMFLLMYIIYIINNVT